MRRDVALLIASRAIRSLAFGYLTFVIPLYLKSIGFSAALIGLYFLVASISSATLVLASGFLGDLIGRRDALIIMSTLFVISMAIFSTTNNKALLFITSVFGTATGSAGLLSFKIKLTRYTSSLGNVLNINYYNYYYAHARGNFIHGTFVLASVPRP
ncbi:hypothetical protein [Vulcanisaeta distributa]|uniref:Major facilitator superfamily (MFS) profile domain-containing protein n=1 Tax=Vulcanisaeta distributa (strain DSM 14429 / JCM 11212 / NBRC 100878 / IC-017) TaxID=572478 RepID=E1QNK4_VULDI|nr:hypothetical protein [Vulcanisaeta distributa]ADN51292.1 hypothetical protein Vdis_1920 [Vulcanisaeta distributa DSM 14429]